MDIFRYFREDYNGHSKSSAYLLAITSHYIYNSGPPGGAGEAFEDRFENLFTTLSESNPFAVKIYADSPPDAFPYDTEVGVLSNSKMIIVVFRGTEGPTGFRDWLTNIKHLMRKAPDSWGTNLNVHNGFYSALSTVYQSVRNRVRQARTNNQKVFLTGHSLGGALATLCAFRLQKVGDVDVNGVYTFGAPRVGDLNFANKYNDILKSKTFRWVYKNDFGPQLPIRAGVGPAPQYVHSGLLSFVRPNGNIEMDHVDTPAGLGTSSIADHDIKRYIFTMQSRLSSKVRQSTSNPAYLVKGDIGSNGYPVV